MKTRLGILAGGTFLLFAALLFQFYCVQIIQHEKWRKLAHRQHEGVVKESFRRGTIWGGSFKLAYDLPMFHLHIDPSAIPLEEKELIADELQHFAIDASEALHKKSRNRRIAMWLSRQEADQILAWWKETPNPKNALFLVKDYQRVHPYGHLLGQVMHTIRNHKKERTDQGIPTGGIESTFNQQLTGKVGKRWITIDPILQAICEEEIEEGVHRVEASGGWVVVMNPHTGEILALAQYPFFDLDRYPDYFNDPDQISDTVVKAVTYAYEPGSVMKPLNQAVCMGAGADPEEWIDVSDGKFPGRRKLLKDPRPYKAMNGDLAIQKSGNVYFGRQIERLIEERGAEWYIEELGRCFGLGKKTDVELPGETAGILPSVGGPFWSKATPWSMAMGYNLMVNAIQMLRAHSVIANGGKLVQPTLVKRDRVEAPQVLDPQVCKVLRHAMRFTTKWGGTARLGNIPGYTEAGKTGTAEKVFDGEYSKKLHFCTFIGFTPAQNPRFIILVAMDEPLSSFRFGGSAAAPVFAKIGKRIHAYSGTPSDADRNDWVAERRDLLKINEEWNGGGP